MSSQLLNPGFNLTLRPMKYPQFYEMYRDGIRNTWTVEEVDFSTDVTDLKSKMTPAERHLIERLVAFFATGDTIVSNNLVLNLYQHINAPEARMFLSRQLYEEALHIQFYLTLLDTYLPNTEDRNQAFAAVDTIPSIRHKAEFCFKWIDSIQDLKSLETKEHRQQFLLNLICFAACIEGLFFFGAFAYVYYLRSRGLLNGLASGTNWVFRDESCMPLDSTEILTESGFVSLRKIVELHPDYKDKKVAQYNEDGSIDFVFSRANVKKHFSGSLVHCKTDKSVSLMVTPDHDNVTRSKSTKKLRKTKAPEMSLSSTSEMICAGMGVGKNSLLSDVERLAIIYQADGSICVRDTGERVGTIGYSFYFVKSRKISRFNNILVRLGFEYSVKESMREGYTLPRLHYRVKVPVEYAHYFDKNFDWISLSDIDWSWARDFVEEVGYWDSYLGQGDRTCVQYVNTNQSAVDKVQAVSSLAGYATSCYLREDNRSDTFNSTYSLFIKKRDYADLHRASLDDVFFEGDVGCVNVPSGMIVVRQNGKVHITGNCHMKFAFEVINVVRQQEPDLFDAHMERQVGEMIEEAISCEMQFAQDVLSLGVMGLSIPDMREYLQYVGDQRLQQLGLPKKYGSKNPFTFMDLQDVQEVTNFFERRVSAYQVGITGDVAFDEDF